MNRDDPADQRLTITCDTCGKDSGVSEDLTDADIAALERLDWSCAVPRIGQPFRFYCPACWPAALGAVKPGEVPR